MALSFPALIAFAQATFTPTPTSTPVTPVPTPTAYGGSEWSYWFDSDTYSYTLVGGSGQIYPLGACKEGGGWAWRGSGVRFDNIGTWDAPWHSGLVMRVEYYPPTDYGANNGAHGYGCSSGACLEGNSIYVGIGPHGGRMYEINNNDAAPLYGSFTGAAALLAFWESGSSYCFPERWWIQVKAPLGSPELTPTPDPNCVGQVYDGGMEQQPVSSYWQMIGEETSTWINARINTLNIFERLVYGPAACGNGMQLVGGYSCGMSCDWNNTTGDTWSSPVVGSRINQNICWPGGNLYYQLKAKANVRSGASGSAKALIDLRHHDIGGVWSQYWLVDGAVDENSDWIDLNGMIPDVPADTYSLTLDVEPINSIDEHGDEVWNGQYILFDDVQISQNPITNLNCSASVDGTPTATPLLSPTATCAPYAISLSNCGFESGAVGWAMMDPNSQVYNHPNFGNILIVAYHTDKGMIGPGVRSSPFVFQPCGNGSLFVKFKYKGRTPIVKIINTSTGQEYQHAPASNALDYFISAVIRFDVPAGTYAVQFENWDPYREFWVDDVGIGSGGSADCVEHQATNTPGASPTRTSTGTTTNTPVGTPRLDTSTPTASASATPIPSFTANATWTPGPPGTPTRTAGPSRTPEPSRTPAPTHTQPPTDTTEPGTETPTPRATYTAPPEPQDSPTPTEGATPTYQPPNPPQQPAPGCYSACLRPSPPTWDIDLGDSIWDKFLSLVRLTNLWNMGKQLSGHAISYVSGWVDYTRCNALSFIVWCPEHTETMLSIPTEFAIAEPFSTIGEIQESYNSIATVYMQYNWDNTGITFAGTPVISDTVIPNWDDWIVPGNSPYNGGQIDITGQTITYASGESTSDCDFDLKQWVGDRLGSGMCFAFSTVHRLGVLTWYQFIVNLCSIIILVTYIYKRWINAGANS